MDLNQDFTPGFFSFAIIRESTSPGPDETLRRYAINRRTAMCGDDAVMHYDFPELAHMQHSIPAAPLLARPNWPRRGNSWAARRKTPNRRRSVLRRASAAVLIAVRLC